jgi:hypothetical protein
MGTMGALVLAASASAGQWSASMTAGGGGGASAGVKPLEGAGCFQAERLAGEAAGAGEWGAGSGVAGAGSMARDAGLLAEAEAAAAAGGERRGW